jgi:hypothetical protein
VIDKRASTDRIAKSATKRRDGSGRLRKALRNSIAIFV